MVPFEVALVEVLRAIAVPSRPVAGSVRETELGAGTGAVDAIVRGNIFARGRW